jgi:hypothetical protein
MYQPFVSVLHPRAGLINRKIVGWGCCVKYTDEQLQKIFDRIKAGDPAEPPQKPITRPRFRKIYKAPGYPVRRVSRFDGAYASVNSPLTFDYTKHAEGTN